ncbi:hypothetical protein CLOM_g21116 [Closterium sp. NIES-68]|nr:hypothetical protein CLOM_g21116 [Closterium sp. NIES-68]GJP77082.1 hypothetical protein CLOP_g7515 [Closterium sp. NIES-67]
MATSPTRTETSNEADLDKRAGGKDGSRGGGASSSEQDLTKGSDPKSLRRLVQNREAARKSRLRKKAYVQQLETSRNRMQQLEQELGRLRNQVAVQGSSTDQSLSLSAGAQGGAGAVAVNPNVNPGAAAFDMEYARWVEEQHRMMCELRSALQSRLGDQELCVLVEAIMTHYDELFRVKAVAAKADVFHLISGMWKTPAERCFLWMGGFRPSELLKVLIPQIEPLTEQQLMGICNLQQSSQQAEDALSQGMEALQQSLADTLSAGSLGAASNVANYMGQMAMAMGKLSTLESFVKQADSLRQQTLQQMHRILTTRQAARGLLAMGDYFARLRALSSLWAARPRDQ